MNILIGITSGIAAHKMIALIDLCLSKGHEVKVMATSRARYMIDFGEIEKRTGEPVYTELFPAGFTPGEILRMRKVEHIEVATWADIVVIAPCTAHTIAKLACGLADDFLCTTILATDAPILLCPSMNTAMWQHAATQRNIELLISYGYHILEPESGDLACGTTGPGRLPMIDEIYKRMTAISTYGSRLKGKKIMVTAGGTMERIDSARVITNRSSGKMGSAIAEECANQGAEVVFIGAKSSAKPRGKIYCIEFESTRDLELAIEQNIQKYDVLFHTAAVSDFTVKPHHGKIESGKNITLELTPTEKIIEKIRVWNPHIKLIGFKAYDGGDENVICQKAHDLIQKTGAEYIIGNDISRTDIAFEANDNEVCVVSKEKLIKIDKMSKADIAKEIGEIVFFSQNTQK